jgi:hypothetical protein
MARSKSMSNCGGYLSGTFDQNHQVGQFLVRAYQF